MDKLKIELKDFQDHFLFSKARFPSLIAGVGTGKTMMLLFKIWNFCQNNPDSLALIVRKEYTDLRDSTIKDFQTYFGVLVDSNKEHKFANGSVIMFRHGSELNVLKNINLSIAGIEQAEEFETEEAFIFIRDRLRRMNAPYHQLCLIGNVNGHNWIWRMWKNNPSDRNYDLVEATTFDNADVLPEDFINDRKQLAIDAPNHYKRYVLNDWEEMEADDYLLTWLMLDASIKLDFGERSIKRILAVDCARFGDDETVFTLIENRHLKLWEQTYNETHKHKDLMWIVGRFIDLKREFDSDIHIVDDDGLGGGVTDRLRELKLNISAFKAGEKAKDELFSNRRAEGFFKLKEMVETKQLKILNNYSLIDQLLTIRYKYNSRGQRLILSKDEMRKGGIKSPDMADALMMAVSGIRKTERAFREEILPAPKVY